MKDLAKFTSELIFTLFLAAVLSALFAWLMYIVAANFNASLETMPYVNFGSGILFGLVVGFKLKELVHHKPPKKKK